MRRIALALLLAAATPAPGQGTDVAVINLLAGQVLLTPQGGAARPAQPYMRVRLGDRFDLAPGAQLRLAFFDGARQERWQGSASLRAGKTRGEPVHGQPVEVVRLPADVPQRIARVPELAQNLKLGGAQVRGIGGSPDIQAARSTYSSLRLTFPASDLTPELYLLSVLEEQRRFDEMKEVVDEMLRKQPRNETARALAEALKSRGR